MRIGQIEPLELPVDAVILGVEAQQSYVVLSAQVSLREHSKKEVRYFVAVTKYNFIEAKHIRYVGMAYVPNASCIHYVYEVIGVARDYGLAYHNIVS